MAADSAQRDLYYELGNSQPTTFRLQGYEGLTMKQCKARVLNAL